MIPVYACLSFCCRYEGAFSRGKRDGQGKYFYANGDSYEGQFKVRSQGIGIRNCDAHRAHHTEPDAPQNE